MRRSILFLTAIALLLFSAAPDAAAQIKYGVTGGFSFPHASNTMNRGTMTKFNAGVTCQFKLPLGFSIQPSLVYHVKGARVGSIEGLQGADLDLAIGYLELPVSFQWGPDLLLFRPFLDVTPYIGVGVNNELYCSAAGTEVFAGKNIWQGAGIARMEYGAGVGIGIEIWRFQVIGRYNWNFSSVYRADENTDTSSQAGWYTKGAFGNGSSFKGLTLSVSFLF
ncbi:MAG: PorT family protein [Bacteroidetes bacterium]|uniref:PorT family protein n=1 Tax=Candidatus Cryptobacteroides intestinigallinarum TaxID=2840767 RepID=A0A9D9HLI2_9BACT|nr:PorT family protein [Candidatus Cryptobacteroides intestinigallinarum]